MLSVSPNYECWLQMSFALLSVSPNRAELPLTRQLGLCVGLRLREGYTAQADGGKPPQCGHVAFCAVAEATLITTPIEIDVQYV